LYGFNDYDEKIGSDENEYAKIFLNPQTWAVLADLTDKETLEKFMDTVENRLKCDYGYLQCYPSYRKGTDRIGRISYFQPGLVENGAVYNHGVAFKVVADCILGRGDNAYASLKAISYDNPKNPDNGVEPYAVSNMYMGPENPHIAGYAPMSWITGTAGWLYRCITEYLCGVQPTMNGLKICPCLPTQWDKIALTRKFRGAIYEIEMLRSNEDKIWMDGKEIEGNILPICESGKREKVTVYYK
jgi:cellobiose phosphorylase